MWNNNTNFEKRKKKGFIYMEIRKAIYGLPQARVLANKLPKKWLAPAENYEIPHTPGLWKHVSRPIEFTLVVDDFGVKYVKKKNIPTISSPTSKENTKYPRIGRAAYIAASI